MKLSSSVALLAAAGAQAHCKSPIPIPANHH
jgi:hypothetical protein